MTVDTLISALAAATLFAMMLGIGLAVRLSEIRATASNVRLLVRAALANYVAVPAVTVALVMWLGVDPAVGAGFLMVAVCPGAPFAPALAAMARANVAAATGLMALLAGSSAVVAPLLLEGLLPLVMPGDAAHVDPGVVAGTLLGSQLAPLFAALVVHEKWPAMSAAARPFVGHVARWLAVGTGVLVLVVYGGLLVHVRPIGLAAMLVLLASSLVAGWWAGRPDPSVARASALATSLRNVGAALAIAGGSFAGTPAASAVIAYFFVEVLGSLAVASRWRLPEVHS